jgi:hypothetical protein
MNQSIDRMKSTIQDISCIRTNGGSVWYRAMDYSRYYMYVFVSFVFEERGAAGEKAVTTHAPKRSVISKRDCNR